VTQNPYPGPPPPPSGGPDWQGNFQPAPDNNLVWGILATLFCCLPLGIVSIVKATQVNSLWMQGRHAEARKAAEDAKKFALWSVVGFVVVVVLYFVVIAGAFASL
jgi:hypothetical protein